jgi:preprotein translocase subunit YajC
VNTAEISFIVILGVLIAFYFMIIRPAQQEQKRQQVAIRDLQVGDEVVTTAGFLGRIKAIVTPEDGPVEVVLDFGNGVEVRALTSSVLRRVAEELEPADQPAEEGT